MNNAPFMRFSKRMLRNNSGMVGLVIILTYLIVATFAARLAPYSPLEQHAADRLQAPNSTYLLGTDEFGRDILSRLMYGATNSLRIAFTAVTVSFVIGTLLGAVSGYFGGWLLGSPIALLVSSVAFSIVMTWVYNNTRASILLMILLHSSSNATLALGALVLPAGMPASVSTFVNNGWIPALTYSLAAIIIVLATRGKLSVNKA